MVIFAQFPRVNSCKHASRELSCCQRGVHMPMLGRPKPGERRQPFGTGNWAPAVNRQPWLPPGDS
eukprot:6800818-Pyramimonas_sp.AAC.1